MKMRTQPPKNQWDKVKAVLRGKFIPYRPNSRKKNNLKQSKPTPEKTRKTTTNTAQSE